MRPDFSIHNKINSHHTNPEAFCDSVLGLLRFTVMGSYEVYFCFVKLGVGMFGASHHLLRVLLSKCSALLGTVPHVVRMCPNEQVIGIYARRIIASVKDLFSFRYGSIVNQPRCPAGNNSLWSDVFLATKQASIPVRVLPGNPIPAFIRTSFINLFPEAFKERVGKSLPKHPFWNSVVLHNISLFDFVPRLRLFLQRSGFSFSRLTTSPN